MRRAALTTVVALAASISAAAARAQVAPAPAEPAPSPPAAVPAPPPDEPVALPSLVAAPPPPRAPVTDPAHPEHVPIARRWWFWAGLGGGAVAVIILGILLSPRDPYTGNAMPGITTVF